MKILYFVFLILLGTCSNDNSNGKPASGNNPPDDRIMAEIAPTSRGGQFDIEVFVYLDISEIVDGHEIRGFGKKPLTVKDASIDKNPMRTVERPTNITSYVATVDRIDQDLKITFEMNGKKYAGTFALTPDDLGKRKTVNVKRVTETPEK